MTTSDDRPTPTVSTTSPWMAAAPLPREAIGSPTPGEAEIVADVCVVGAGVAGLSTAYALACEGKRVVVVDAGPVGGGETGASTAHLASYVDDRLVTIERRLGEAGASLVVASHAAGIDWIEATIARERIDCGFRRVDGYLFRGAGTHIAIEDELCAMQRAGLAAELVSRAPFSAIDTGPAVRIPDQAQLDPVAYVAGLATAVVRLGGVIATPHQVTRIEPTDDGVRVVTEDGLEVQASTCVVATHVPIAGVVGQLDQETYRTYAVAVVVQDGTLPSALYWDTADPYHYVRVIEGPDGSPTDLVVVGGEDRWTGDDVDPEARFAELETYARDVLGAFLSVAHRWSGIVLEPVDGLAFLGRAREGSDRVFVLTGDSGQGITHAAIGASIVCDTLAGRPNAWAALYDPQRSTARRTVTPSPVSGTHPRVTLPSPQWENDAWGKASSS